MRPAETLKPRVFVSSGSDGCHLFSSEPEDESASVGACGGIQFSPETQHEETHLNGHVDPCFSPTSFDLTLSDSYANKKKQKVRAHPQPQVLASQNYCLPGFLLKKKKIYLFETPEHLQSHTHTHTGRGCVAEVSRRRTEEPRICYCWGDRLVFISTASHMHLPSSPFILSSFLCEEETHQLMFSFTVIGWLKSCFG